MLTSAITAAAINRLSKSRFPVRKPMTKETGAGSRTEGKLVTFRRRAAFSEAHLADLAGRLYASAASRLIVLPAKWARNPFGSSAPMPSQHAHGSTHNDLWVEHRRGRIFARVWSPVELQGGPVADTPIVLFHDSLGCVDLWRTFPAALCASTGGRVIAYDRLGFGRSDARGDELGMDFIADEAKTYFPTIRQQVGFNRFVAFGHSVGGGMAVHCAAQFAEACEALITESAQAFPEDRTLQSISSARERFKAAGQVERLEKYHGKKARWVLGAWIETWLHPDFAAWSLEPVLPRVTCPLLAIHGAHDEYGSTRHPRMIAELSTGRSRMEIIPDAYHVPHREREGVIVDLVRDFIASIG